MTSQPGDQLGLFGEPARAARRRRVRRVADRAADLDGPSRPRGDRLRAARAPARGAPRARRRASRRTGEPHRAIHARINRDVGRGVGRQATVDQLEKGNALLEREARAVTMDALPDWPEGTPAILSTVGDGVPHAIPVSLALKAGPRELLIGLAPRRESLANLRADPPAP